MTTFLAVAKVPCRGVEHRLALTRQGRLVPLDHDVVRERAYVAAGGQEPFCLQFLGRVFQYNQHGLIMPEELWAYTRQWSQKRDDRSHVNAAVEDYKSSTSHTVRFRTLIKFREQATRYLDRCVYAIRNVSVCGAYSVGERIDEPLVATTANGLCLRLQLPWRWWRHVHLKGVAVVCGGVDLIDRGKNYYFVMDNLTPSQLVRDGVWLRVLVHNYKAQWTTRRAYVVGDRILQSLPEEIGNLQLPCNRDYP